MPQEAEMAEMRENRVKRVLREGGCATVLGGINNPEIMDYMGQFGFDGMWIETEHGSASWEQVAHMSRACDLWGLTSVCRVNSNEPWLITRTLDVGATGIVVPHVNNREEAERAARSAKYAPAGYRGMYTGRQSYGVADYYRRSNEETLVVALIEETRGVDKLDEILTVDNVDVYFIAPSDLAQTMGYTGQPNHPAVLAVVDKCISRIVAAGRVAGALVTEETVESYVGKGARFFLTSWQPWVGQGARRFLSRVAAKGA
jgi:4-hydroxy-2-oxoheptanedioate aldolase